MAHSAKVIGSVALVTILGASQLFAQVHPVVVTGPGEQVVEIDTSTEGFRLTGETGHGALR